MLMEWCFTVKSFKFLGTKFRGLKTTMSIVLIKTTKFCAHELKSFVVTLIHGFFWPNNCSHFKYFVGILKLWLSLPTKYTILHVQWIKMTIQYRSSQWTAVHTAYSVTSSLTSSRVPPSGPYRAVTGSCTSRWYVVHDMGHSWFAGQFWDSRHVGHHTGTSYWHLGPKIITFLYAKFSISQQIAILCMSVQDFFYSLHIPWILNCWLWNTKAWLTALVWIM